MAYDEPYMVISNRSIPSQEETDIGCKLLAREGMKLSPPSLYVLETGTTYRKDQQLPIPNVHHEANCKRCTRVPDVLQHSPCSICLRTLPELPNRLQHVYFALTNKCNLHCIHCCCNAKFTPSPHPISHKLSTKDVLQLLVKIIALAPDTVTFTGGEPMLRPDFFTILHDMDSRFAGEIHLSTNATLITKENVSRLCSSVDSVHISLDGVNNESCQQIRGPGVFEKVMESVTLLQSSGNCHISLSLVLMEHNRHLEEAFYELNHRLGTRPIVKYFIPTGRGKAFLRSYLSYPVQSCMRTSITQSERFDDFTEPYKCNCDHNAIIINYDGTTSSCCLPTYPDCVPVSRRALH
ncbi:radical SAM protein [Paenibacillus taiwanensis]|uniref:radical SAM protein n=1 Tax=Paenibacillus taiwanensis TaxID=401638 RepID=UPI00042196B9|nr:radical SAM protein [Paenibacillus taiwanensis]